MFAFSRVPRVFILAGIILILLVLGTNRYLYDDETYYPSSVVPQPGPKEGGLGHATRPDDATVVDETIGVASTDKADVSAKASAAPVMAPSLTSSAQPVATTAELLHAGGNKQDDSLSPILTLGPCSELEFLKRAHTKQGLTDELRYKKICFQPVFSDNVDRNVIANVSTQIFGDEMTIDVNNCEQARLSTCTPIKLEVPRPYADYSVSHLIFGIATDYTRLEESLESFAHWLSRPSGKGAKLLALVTDYHQREASEIQQLQQKFSSLGINADLVKPLRKSYTTSQNHFTVLAHMLDSSTPDTQWYGLLDDDTFFPRGLKPLSDALSKLDHSQDHYVGALSEDFMAIRTFGFMAFGGAGAYLSAPLAKTMGRQLHRCIEEATGREGDIIIRDCVYQNSKAKLTILPGLFQQDMKDDASGFFEAGVEAINFHHWKSWYHSPVIEMAAAALYCGDCFLQRWRFGTDTVFTNGFSIVRYLYDIADLNLDRMEGTWSNANRDFDFSIGPLRRKLVPDEKRSFQLRDVEFTKNGEFKQLYIWKGNPAAGEADGVIEVVWKD